MRIIIIIYGEGCSTMRKSARVGDEHTSAHFVLAAQLYACRIAFCSVVGNKFLMNIIFDNHQPRTV